MDKDSIVPASTDERQSDLSHGAASALCCYNDAPLRRCRPFVFLAALAAMTSSPQLVGAQAPAPIPWYVVDLHGITVNFPRNANLAFSRGLNLEELPGRGLGGDIALHIYPYKYRAVTFGIGGRAVIARAHQEQTQPSGQRAVSERFTYLAPQLSFNFGTASGWSYISGGLAGGRWSIHPDGALPQPQDQERLLTIDYGGGARWFAKPHVAFSFDVRFYAINPGSPTSSLPGGPRSRLFVFGAGVSVK
jgi:hypothetical protein